MPDSLRSLDSALQTFSIEECNHQSLKLCCAQALPASLAGRLCAFAAWLAREKTPGAQIVKDLDIRRQTLKNDSAVTITPSCFAMTGDTASGIIITAYASASCSLCKRLVREVYISVTKGALKGKAALRIKPFSADLGDCALLAAQKQDRFWDYFYALALIQERPTRELLLHLSDSLNFKETAFMRVLDDPASKVILEQSVSEGRNNGVTITPTFFINNRRYRSYKDSRWVIDAAEYRYELARNNRKK
jgi:protein-disulfide isomerase